jgi:hypothetical protein
VLILKYKLTAALFALLGIVYLLQVFLYRTSSSTLTKYHISQHHAQTIVFSVAAPYLIVWFVALLGYLGLKAYVHVIDGGKDGKGFSLIAKGLFFLVLWLPTSSIISSFVAHVYTLHPHLTPSMVMLNNYLGMVLLIPAFILIDAGAKRLVSLVKKPVYTLSQGWTIAFICFAVLYTLLTIHDPARHDPTKLVSVASYYEPDWVIVTTIIIPRLITWFLGAQAVQNIYRYRKQIKGALYTAALGNLAFGLASAITCTIILRCAQSISTDLERLSLSLVLVVVYSSVLLIGISYVFVVKGARKLRRIEEL